MSGFGGGKTVRNYGEFSTSSTASSLFDAAFSKPVVRKRFAKFPSVNIEEPILPSVADEHNSPQQVFSPPISLPESSSTEGNLEDRNIEESGSEDDEPMDIAPPSQNNKKLTATTSSHTNSQASSTIMKRKCPASSSYDFDEKDEANEEVALKRGKKEDSESPKTKFLPRKEHRNIPIYRHKWTENPEDEEEYNDQKTSNIAPVVSKNATKNERNARIRKVMDAQECLESGQLDDYRQDLQYIMTSLNETDVSTNIKTLSAFTLTKKCVIRGFRHFLRNEMNINQILRQFPDVAKDQNMALCVSAFIYIMARDLVPMKLDSYSLRIISQLLKIELLDKTIESKRNVEKVWQVFNEYVEKSEVNGKRFSFEIKKEKLTPSALILEALVYLLARASDEEFKTELLNFGCLQYVVVKLEKIVLRLIHDKSAFSSGEVLDDIGMLERCFRIIEYSTTYHKKNQHFLISHRGGVLIQMCGKLTSLIHMQLPTLPEKAAIIEHYLKSLSLIARVLCNLSHDSELCSSKLGMIDEFLKLTLETFTFITPKYGDGDSKYDLMVMTLGLMVNLVEKVNSNRSKILSCTVRLVLDDGTISEEKALDALVKKFVLHEEKARAVDEDLDKDLFFEEPIDDENNNSDDEEGSSSQSGRLDRGKIDDMTEAEMLDVVQNAMGKASAHMEDSVVASYLALVIGCLLQQHDEFLSRVKSYLPNGSLTVIKEQLQRFQEFMKIANPKSRGSSSIGRIISLLDDLE